MKKYLYITGLIIGFWHNSQGQSITITPNPTNGAMVEIKNLSPADDPDLNGTNHTMTVPLLEALPASPPLTSLVFFQGKLWYYNGMWVKVESANNIIPPSTIVLSETKTNTDLTAAGFTLKGFANLPYYAYQMGEFGWAKALSNLYAPSTRFNHTAVWTGSKMIVWGGISAPNGSVFNDGGIYDPLHDLWTPIPSVSLEARLRHNALWTDDKMFVWGGQSAGNSANYYGNGAMYNPNANSWEMVSSTNAPTARSFFSIVWTGSKVIIWGGYGSTSPNFRNDGKIYEPSTNTWANMSSVNAPSAREGHTAVWTGSKMIVWGGREAPNALNSGGIYDPATDSWATISNAGVPAMALHTAIWTGSEMIVFGGQNMANASTNVCYRYNPNTNTWTQASSTHLPSTRNAHTAVWTGNKMIIFGGSAIFVGLRNDGGLYDPSTNTWALNNIAFTTNMDNHTAIWTGEDMLIFGGGIGHTLKSDFKTPATKSVYLYQKN
jgi:N-acetylneuraminic acid mutarotase